MITRGPATPIEAGRACPYCRSPLVSEEQVARCPACTATHHAECWDENHGCATVACPSGPQPASGEAAAKSGGKPLPPLSPPPTPPPGVPPRPAPVPVSVSSHPAWRNPVIAVGAGVVALIVVIAIVTSSGGDTGANGTGTGLSTLGLPTTPTSGAAVTTGLDEPDTLAVVHKLLVYSMSGREATINGELERGIAIRQEILEYLDALATLTGEMADVRALLATAMRAQIDANTAAYECGDCALTVLYNEDASAAKQNLVDTYNVYADHYGTSRFYADEI